MNEFSQTGIIFYEHSCNNFVLIHIYGFLSAGITHKKYKWTKQTHELLSPTSFIPFDIFLSL